MFKKSEEIKMFKENDWMQPQREIPQTEDDIVEAEVEIGCTEDDILQTEDEIVQTKDIVIELQRKKDSRKNNQPGQLKIRNKQLKEQATRKKKAEAQRVDIRRIVWMLQEVGPYLVAFLVVSIVAFGILVIVRNSVDAYGENVLQKNEEYLLYESGE